MLMYAESTLKMPLGKLKNIIAKDNTKSNSISALDNLHFFSLIIWSAELHRRKGTWKQK